MLVTAAEATRVHGIEWTHAFSEGCSHITDVCACVAWAATCSEAGLPTGRRTWPDLHEALLAGRLAPADCSGLIASLARMRLVGGAVQATAEAMLAMSESAICAQIAAAAAGSAAAD